MVSFEVVRIEKPEDANVILLHSHFIKTVEDIYEALAESSKDIKFGIAFCEASGKCLIRYDGNDEELIEYAIKNAEKIRAGHTVVILIRNAWPINVLNRLKQVSEITRIYTATANPLQVIIAKTDQGRGIIGVVDGFETKGVEKEEDKKERFELLRKFGYKPKVP